MTSTSAQPVAPANSFSHDVALLGGTGPQGRGLAMRLAMAGLRVVVGSRSAEKAAATAEELAAKVQAQPQAPTPVVLQGMANEAAMQSAPLVFLTVPFEQAGALLTHLQAQGQWQAGQVLVDVTVPLSFEKGVVRPVRPPEGSGSQHLRTLLAAEVPLTGAAKTLPAHLLEELEAPLDCDTFVLGDDATAREQVAAVLAKLPGLRPVDVGGLSAAEMVEGMTALLIRINRRRKSLHGRFSVVGI